MKKTTTSTTLGQEPTTSSKTTISAPKNTTTKPNIGKKTPDDKKLRLKPPDIDKLTPVALPIKVHGTVVNDLKGFLAKKTLERENKQAKMHGMSQDSPRKAGGKNQTKPSKE